MEVRFDDDNEVFICTNGERTYYYNDKTNSCSPSLSSVLKKKFPKPENTEGFFLKIIPSNCCNLKCSYCFSENDRKNKEIMSYDKILPYLRTIKEQQWTKMSISFTGGGEPTRNFECIRKITEFLHMDNSVHFNMTTNGIFPKEYLDFLIKHGFNVAISIDGEYELENSQQLSELTRSLYDQALSNAKALIHAGNEVTSLTVITERTVSSYMGMEDLLIKATLDYLYQQEFRAMGITFDKNIFLHSLSDEIISSMAEFCLLTARWHQAHPDTIVVNHYVYSKNRSFSDHGVCQGLQNMKQNITILPDGKISFCHKVQDDEFCEKQYNPESIRRVKGNPRIGELTEAMFDQKKKCKTCIARQTCMGSVCPVMFIENTAEQNELYCVNNLRLRKKILECAIFQ